MGTYQRAIDALGRALERVTPGLTLDGNGYAGNWTDNLLAGTDRKWFEKELNDGAGKELASKFRAAHSSSALAVNTFARFKTECESLSIAGWTGCESFRFEAKCPAGIVGRRGLESPPNLDLLAEGDGSVLAIESKCTEHINSRAPMFSPAYNDQIKDGDTRRNSAWFKLMERMQRAEYCHLDAAQLIKHAYGLARCYPNRNVTLLYLYWEPRNADAFIEFRDHRKEVVRFAGEVEGSLPEFKPMTYRQLWDEWSGVPSPPWLAYHLSAVRDRYDVDI